MRLRRKLSVFITSLMIMALVPQNVPAAEEMTDEVVLSADTAEEADDTGSVDMGADDEVTVDEEQISEEEIEQDETEGQILQVEEAVEATAEYPDADAAAEDDLDADGYSVDDFEYRDNDTGVTITGFTGQDIGSLNIPASLDGKRVTAIGSYAFSGKRGFQGKLTFPATVTSIDYRAFSNCTGFTGLELPASIETIGDYAFDGCIAMVGTLSIPSTVTEMGTGAFEDCSGFTGLELGSGLTDLGIDAFSRCRGITNNVVIPDGITEIPDHCFYRCEGIPSVSVSAASGLTLIGPYAFSSCTALRTFKFGPSVTTIGGSAFSGCTALEGQLVIPASVTEIGSYAFNDCTSVSGLVLPEGLTELGNYAFSDCASITGTVRIPRSVTSFGSYAFYKAGSGATLVLENGLKEIGTGAFAGSGFKGKIEIPSSMTAVANHAFQDANLFTSLKLGSNLTVIGYGAFENCSGLSGTLTIPNTVTTIGDSAFDNCSGFTKMKLSSNLSAIGNYAFGHCSGIKELTVPAMVTSIDASAFYGMFYVGTVTNKCRIEIRAYNFIDNSGGGDSYFVNTRTKRKITRDGSLGKGTFKRKVSKLATPQISVCRNASSGIALECNKVYGAVKYVWLRGRKSYGNSWKKLATTSKPSYTDKSAANGTLYYYRVYALKGKVKSRESASKDMCRLKGISLKSAKNTTKGTLTLKWSKNTKGSGYAIVYGTDKSLDENKVKTVSGKKKSSGKVTGLKKGKTYYVRVAPYKTVNGKKYYGSTSGTKSVIIRK